MFTIEWIGMLLVPIAYSVLKLLTIYIKKINIFLWMMPITTYAITNLYTHIFMYSPLSYLGLVYSILGVFMLFYNFRRNRLYTFKIFFKRLTILYSKVALLIWFIISIYQVIHYIIV